MKKIKVLTIITRHNIGGATIQAILSSSNLNKNKYQSFLVKGSEGKDEGNMDDFAKRKKIEPVYIKELSREISLRKDLIAFWKLYQLIKREKPDIVHTHLAKAGTLGRIAAKLAGAPLIVHTFHGNLFHEYFDSIKSRLILNLERLLMRVSTRIIAISHSQEKELLEYRIGDPRKISCIPLGIELDPFLTSENNRGIFRGELNLDNEVPLIGIVARLVPIKGHIYFFKAVKIVSEDFPEARFIVIGNGELREELENLASELGIKKCVIFCGFRDDLVNIYADLDIVVLSSLNEGFPVSIIEALAAKKPVVATDVGGVKELVEDKVTGVLVPKQNPQRLAQGIIYLLKNPQKALRFGENGRKKVYPAFDYTRLVSDIEGLYENLLARLNKFY